MITIKVTQKHIDRGDAGNSIWCPVARALIGQIGGRVRVGSTTFRRDIDLRAQRFPLPRSACRFIAQFDNHKPVKPFNFRIEAG